MKERLKKFFSKQNLFVFICLSLIIAFCVLYVILNNNDKKNMENKQSEIVLNDSKDNLYINGYSNLPNTFSDITYQDFDGVTDLQFFETFGNFTNLNYGGVSNGYYCDVNISFYNIYSLFGNNDNVTCNLTYSLDSSDFPNNYISDLKCYIGNCDSNVISDLSFDDITYNNALCTYSFDSFDDLNINTYKANAIFSNSVRSYNGGYVFVVYSYYHEFNTIDNNYYIQMNASIDFDFVIPSLRDYNTLNASYTQLQTSYNNLVASNQQLQSDYNTLNASYTQLQTSYNNLVASNQQLQNDYNTLLSNYNNYVDSHSFTNDQYNSLNALYTQLQSDYNTLNGLYTQLQSDYNNLQATYDEAYNDGYNDGYEHASNLVYKDNAFYYATLNYYMNLTINNYAYSVLITQDYLNGNQFIQPYSLLKTRYSNDDLSAYVENTNLSYFELIFDSSVPFSLLQFKYLCVLGNDFDYNVSFYCDDNYVWTYHNPQYISDNTDNLPYNEFLINFNGSNLENRRINKMTWRRQYNYEIGTISNDQFAIGYSEGVNDTTIRLNEDIKALEDENKDLNFEIRSLQESLENSLNTLAYSFISSVMSTPFNILHDYLNWNFFGINLFSLFTSLITLLVVIWVIKFLLGRK